MKYDEIKKLAEALDKIGYEIVDILENRSSDGGRICIPEYSLTVRAKED
jgi:monoamine oxidase